MSLSALSATATPPSYQAIHQSQSPQRATVDRDGDNDNDAKESAATKAKELQKPLNSARGNNLNIAV